MIPGVSLFAAEPPALAAETPTSNMSMQGGIWIGPQAHMALGGVVNQALRGSTGTVCDLYWAKS